MSIIVGDYTLADPVYSHDQPVESFMVAVFNNDSGELVARVYSSGGPEATEIAREFAAARAALNALRLVLTLHEQPEARAKNPESWTCPYCAHADLFGGGGPLLDPKAAEQVRNALKLAGKL